MGFNVGETVGDYEIVGMLGAGGMGKVYKVRNVISDRVEAIKVLLPDLTSEAELADRFMREIKLLASLNHPNIAGLHTALRLENQLLMVMEFVEGRTLDDRLKDGPVPVREAVGYACQALSALGYAHERGVIHRDIKPANMMVTASGDLKLMDFGIAKAVADRRLTMTGTTLGSIYYMSPEQVKGSTSLDGRSDLYSMGVSLYELVTGTRPFKGESDYSLMVAHLEQQPVPPIQIDPTLPPALNEIILTAIQKDPARRFQAAPAMRVALESVAKSLGVSVPAPMPMRPAAPPQPVPGPTMTTPVAAQAPTPWPSAPPSPLAQTPHPPAYAPGPPPQGFQPGPPQAFQPGPPQAPPPGPPQRAGHRGLWMALGAVAAVLVIVLGALQLPRLLKTRAGAPATQETGQPAVQSVESPAAAPSTAPAETTPGGKAEAGAGQPAQPAVVQAPAATPAAPPAQAGRPRGQAIPVPVVRGTRGQQVATPAPAGRQPAEAPQEAAAPPVHRAPAVDPAVIEELRDRLGAIGSRANALRGTLENLQQQQRAQGVGLRTDIAASWKHMEYLLDEAEAALKAGDAVRARRNLDQAEHEADSLDKFLGH